MLMCGKVTHKDLIDSNPTVPFRLVFLTISSFDSNMKLASQEVGFTSMGGSA